jgi:hypothetical protein
MAKLDGKAEFTTDLDVQLKRGSDSIWIIRMPLLYYSPKYGDIEIKAGFETDFASVPRLPIAYALWGNKTHREPVLHDFAFCKDSGFTFKQANDLFLEAMTCTGKPRYIRYPMYWAVCAFSYPCFHRRNVDDKL